MKTFHLFCRLFEEVDEFFVGSSGRKEFGKGSQICIEGEGNGLDDVLRSELEGLENCRHARAGREEEKCGGGIGEVQLNGGD